MARMLGAMTLLAALLACACARADTLSIPGRLGAHHRATFSLAAVGWQPVAGAVVVRGRWHRRIPARRVDAALRLGVLTVRVAGSRARSVAPPALVLTVDDPQAADAPAQRPAGGAPQRAPAPAPAPAPQPDPAPAPAPAPEPPLPPQPSPGEKAPLLPPGSRVLGDDEAAAHVRRVDGEVRPDNAAANQRVPTHDELDAYRRDAENWRKCKDFHKHVTGDFTGTTDEIIQWAAWKWGLDEDIVRAEAAVETWWRQSFVGDNGESFGLMQIRRTFHTGTYPLSAESTAFNVDFYAAMIRQYYDGCATWLDDVPHGQPYQAGDIWGSVGAWFQGEWHTPDAERYIARVQDYLARRVWEQRSFS